MSSSHVPTSTNTNLTRLELEELRKADAASQGKAVTRGDDGTVVGGVGIGSATSEPFSSGPVTALDDVYGISPTAAPGSGLSSTTQVHPNSSATVRWYGPTYVSQGATGYAGSTTTWQDDNEGDFTSAVAIGDFIIIKPNGSSPNDATTAVVTNVTTNVLTLGSIRTAAGATVLTVESNVVHSWAVVRKSASRLFALPGSGTFRSEQSFLFVTPSSSLHTQANPTIAAINADRITDIVPPKYNTVGADRADALFAPGGCSAEKIGYRVVLYPDNGAGAPDYTKPILTVNPVINTSLPPTEQRMTIDYKAGVVRLSCAPSSGSDINPAGVYSTKDRVNLWAIFWAFDQSLTRGTARGLYAQRSTDRSAFVDAQVRFDLSRKSWLIASSPGQEFYVKTLPFAEDPFLAMEFGTRDDTSATPRGRYFKYARGSNKWVMRSTGDSTLDIDRWSEVEVAEKRSITVGDASAPMLAPGEFNPTTAYSGSAIGLRQTTSPLSLALLKAYREGHSTVSLRKGRYYNDSKIVIPPGVTLEGDGPSTRIFSKAGTSTDFGTLFGIGPNTPWGVYDATYDGSTVVPLSLYGSATTKCEGFDIVWNPVRRVWGMVQADPTNNAIWFNEMRLDGTQILGGRGQDIKGDANLLYMSSSPGGSFHTSSHYPRIAYHEAQDEYAVVWVEKDPVFSGPVCKIQVVDVTNTANISNANVTVPTYTKRFTTTAQAKMVGSGNFCDHPSVAVDNANPATGYAVAVSYWSYGPTLTPTEMWTSVYNSSTLADISVQSQSLTTKHVVSSTDVQEDNSGGFLWAWSERNHPLLMGVNGDVTIGVFTDTVFTGVSNFTVNNVEVGDRFLYLGGNILAGGFEGVVSAVSGTNLSLMRDDGTSFPDTSGNPLTWAIVPRGQIFTKRKWAGQAIIGPAGVITQTPGASTYRLEVREPDFVRLSRGGSSWLLVYQAFDSSAFLSKPNVKNFDNGIVSTIGSAGLVLKDKNAYREHIATCSMLLADTGEASSPIAGESINAASVPHISRDLNVSSRSLGARDPLNMSPNGYGVVHNVRSINRQVSARNYFHKWTTTVSPSLIPDVTWTGQDWVVVSPSLHEIRSLTGTYTISGPDLYLSDPSFYFGADGLSTSNGAYLRKTVTPGTDRILLVASGAILAITSIHSEHVIKVSVVSGTPPVTGTTNLEWVLMKPDTLAAAGGLKTPGFRVAADGSLISGTSYFTFADEVDESLAPQRRAELAVRKNGNGINDPADLAMGYNDPAFSQSGIWGDVSFKGVAAGSARGCASNNDVLGEWPKTAIAWGETSFGLLERDVAGTGTTGQTNRVNCYRQCFGPYRSGIRNLSMVGANSANYPITNYLQPLTREHVLTRHGAPATSSGGFATDGFRNCFVTPVMTKFDTTDSATILRYPSAMQAYYTTATGSDALALRGPGALSIPAYNISADYIADLFSDLPNPTGAPSDFTLANSRPSSPKVIWDGTRFVACWTESNAIAAGADGIKHGLICLGVFPGGEDQGNQGPIITGDTFFNQSVTEFAAVTVGNTNTTSPARQIYCADLAYSGSVYAALWTGGQNPSDAAGLGGSSIGVTIFYGTGKNSAGRTFVIDTSTKRGGFQDGKILWDGRQFVAVWRQHDLGANKGRLYYSIIPENGFGATMQLKRLSGRFTSSGTAGTQGLGVAGASSTIDTSANPIPCQTGDLVNISKNVTAGPTDDLRSVGWYVVKDYDPTTNVITLHTNGGGDVFTGITGSTVYGVVISAGQGDPASLMSVSGVVYQPAGNTASKPTLLTPTTSWGSTNQTIDNFERLDGFTYNEVEDEYAVLVRTSAGDIALTAWKRGSFAATPEREFALIGGGGFAANLAWNGRNYLLVYTHATGSRFVSYLLLGSKFAKEGEGDIDTDTVIGNGIGQIPGPGYGALDSAATIQPRIRNLDVKWNNRLNRWVVSASYLWYDDVTGGTTNTQIKTINNPSAAFVVSSFSQRSISISPGDPHHYAQVGCRLVGYRTEGGGKVSVYSPTIKSINGAGSTWTTDTSFAEASADAQSNFGVPGGPLPLTIGVVTREDVVCWTVGYKAPAVKLLDADDVFFEGVEFAGGYVDIEERYRHMVRPTWQNGGVSFGKPQTLPALPEHVNHVLLRPANKTAPLAFTNVRSMTSARHGQGTYLNLPKSDRKGR